MKSNIHVERLIRGMSITVSGGPVTVTDARTGKYKRTEPATYWGRVKVAGRYANGKTSKGV